MSHFLLGVPGTCQSRRWPWHMLEICCIHCVLFQGGSGHRIKTVWCDCAHDRSDESRVVRYSCQPNLLLGRRDSDISGASTIRRHAFMMLTCSSACNIDISIYIWGIPLEASSPMVMAAGPDVQSEQALIEFIMNLPSFLVAEDVGLPA